MHTSTTQHVYGNDREVLTYDDAGGTFWGKAMINGTKITLSGDPYPDTHSPGDPFAGWLNAEVQIVNGTGFGEYRRVVATGMKDSPRAWTIDKPFDAASYFEGFIQIQPFRGRTLHAYNRYADTGAVQLYGHATDVILAHNVGERMTGFVSWGQWRGWTEPPTNHQLQGSFGIGNNPVSL